MGLLDDAIREHLDLKRRRGADPAEVERAEREALGPVRRNRDPSESLESEPQATAQVDAPAFDHEEHDGDWATVHEPAAPLVSDDATEVVPPPVFDDELGAEPPPPPHPAALPEYADEHAYEELPHAGEAAGADLPPAGDHGPAPPVPLVSPAESEDRDWSAADDDGLGEPFPTAPPAAPRDAGSVGEETTEYRIHERPPHDDEDIDDDVLEETPEFLQDTPDHDRLWFEQRPPRDFDFDG